MQRIYHRVASRFRLRIAGRQEDNDIAVNGIAFQIAFERGAVHFNVFNGDRLGARHDVRHFSTYLCSKPGIGSEREPQYHCVEPFCLLS